MDSGRLKIGGMEVTVTVIGNIVYLSDLTGKGSPADLGSMIASVKKMAKDYEVYLTVEFGPRFDQLMKVYTGKGAVPKAVLMKVEF